MNPDLFWRGECHMLLGQRKFRLNKGTRFRGSIKVEDFLNGIKR